MNLNITEGIQLPSFGVLAFPGKEDDTNGFRLHLKRALVHCSAIAEQLPEGFLETLQEIDPHDVNGSVVQLTYALSNRYVTFQEGKLTLSSKVQQMNALNEA